MAFQVGDKVSHVQRGKGEVKYGPFEGPFACAQYVISYSGTERVANERDLSSLPLYAVGDSVTYGMGVRGEVVAGPFNAIMGINRYVIKRETGVHNWVREAEISGTPYVEHEGVKYFRNAKYRDNEGDVWEFNPWDDTANPVMSIPNRPVRDRILSDVVRYFGPLTQV